MLEDNAKELEINPLTNYRCSLFELIFYIDDTLPYFAFTVDWLDPEDFDEEEISEDENIAL